eukprot:384578-Pelagomonas_calceolata.AAC.4
MQQMLLLAFGGGAQQGLRGLRRGAAPYKGGCAAGTRKKHRFTSLTRKCCCSWVAAVGKIFRSLGGISQARWVKALCRELLSYKLES